MLTRLAATLLFSASALLAQCNTHSLELRTKEPWLASFVWGGWSEKAVNQFVDVTAAAPLTVNRIFATSYSQAAGAGAPPNQVGNVAEVRVYTFPVTHVGNEGSIVGWTHVATAEMTVAAWPGDSLIENFKDPVSGLPSAFVLPVGSYGLCIEFLPTSWSGTLALPQTNVPLLNPGGLTTLAFMPAVIAYALASDSFLSLSGGALQSSGWHGVSNGMLVPSAFASFSQQAEPNIGFDYTPVANAGRSSSIGGGCYDLPFMIYDQIPANQNPASLVGQSFTATLQASTASSFYSIQRGGIPYAAPPAGATNLTMSGTAPLPVAHIWNSIADATWSHTLTAPLQIPSPGGGLMATELGINSNGKVYFSTAAPTATTVEYNGPSLGDLRPFRDLDAQWAVFHTELDPSSGVGNIYVMEPSPNLGGVMIWWHGLPNSSVITSVTSSFSIEFSPDGSTCNLAYGSDLATDGNNNHAIVGFSAGHGEPIGAEIDWATIPSAPNSVSSGDGSAAPTMDISARPIGGNVVDLILGDLPDPAAPGLPRIGLFAMSTSGTAGVELGLLGMPDCFLFVGAGPILITGFEDLNSNSGEIREPLALPLGFTGTDVYVQGVTLHPVFAPNPLGMTLSSALCLTIGSI